MAKNSKPAQEPAQPEIDLLADEYPKAENKFLFKGTAAGRYCEERHAPSGLVCTRLKDHKGWHVAHVGGKMCQHNGAPAIWLEPEDYEEGEPK